MNIDLTGMLKTVASVWGETVIITRPSTSQTWEAQALQDQGDNIENIYSARIKSPSLVLQIIVEPGMEAPIKADQVTFKTEHYTIKNDPRITDPARNMWTVELT